MGTKLRHRSSWIQGFTVADFLTENTIRTGAGQRIDHLSSWVLPDGSVRVDAVWHSVPGAWAFVQGFTVADFVTEDTMRRSTGWRLDELQSFVLADGGVRVDALWHIGPEQSFWVQGYTVEDFRSIESDLRCDGWQLQKLSSFVLADGGVRVDAVWHRPATPGPTALCQDVVVTAGPSCTGTITPQMVDNGSFDPSGAPPSLSLSSTGPFARGTHQVTLTATSGGRSSQCTASVTVVDGTTPTITAPPNVSTTQCLSPATITVGRATGADNCGTPEITGTVISSNGVAPPTPIIVNGTQVTLGDRDPRHPVDSQGRVERSVGIPDGDRGPAHRIQRQLPGRRSGPGNQRIGRAGGDLEPGSGQTQVGYDARTGGIVSLGPVTALDRATIGGDIFSGSTITAPHATVNGNQFQFASVILPALPSLPSFPPATGGDITVNSGTQTRGPGSYNVATLNGGTLTLTGSGDYYFRTLTINNGATIRVAANSRVFVQNSLAYRSPFRPPTGSTVQTVYLGFAGTSVTMEAPYNGTMVAPNATVQFGTGAGLTFNGSFFAGTIEVRPASVLVCL